MNLNHLLSTMMMSGEHPETYNTFTLFERGINRGQLNRVLIFGMEKQTTLK